MQLPPVSCTMPSLPPEGAGVPVLCTDPVASVVHLHRHPVGSSCYLTRTFYVPGMIPGFIPWTFVAPPGCHIQVASVFQLRKLRHQKRVPSKQGPGCVWKALVAWWYVLAACCFLRCLDDGLSVCLEVGTPMRSGGLPGIVGVLPQPIVKGKSSYPFIKS